MFQVRRGTMFINHVVCTYVKLPCQNLFSSMNDRKQRQQRCIRFEFCLQVKMREIDQRSFSYLSRELAEYGVQATIKIVGREAS